MFLGKIDLAMNNAWKAPNPSMHTGTVVIPGGYAFSYGDHSDPASWRIQVWVQPQSAVGQYAAKTQAAAEFLGRQVEEMVRNPDMQPIYLQLYAGTGTLALPQNFTQPHDGFYNVKSARVGYSRSLQGFFMLDLDVEYVSPGPPRTIGMGLTGAALSTGFGGTVTNWAAYPLNATIPLVDATRTGAEGAVQVNISPPLNPSPFVPSATVSDWWKGGCQVHDVMAGIGTNAVPLAGLFTNANWIEVFGKDHRFIGDVVITNGFHLWSLSLAASPGITGYAWIAGAWQQFGTLTYNDQAGNAGTLRQVTLQRVGLEEIRADCWLSTSGNKWAKLSFRLQRGTWNTRLEFTPLAETNSIGTAIKLTLPSAGKIVYNPSQIADLGVITFSSLLTNDTTFGYSAVIIANNGFPFLTGFLAQDTLSAQPSLVSTTVLGYGDSGGPSQNATKQYGVFCAPIATPANLQSLAGGGTLGTGWTNVPDAAQSPPSNGTVGRCASGTLAGNADLFGTAWSPSAGKYDLWVRARVTANAGTQAEMTIGVWNPTTSSYVASGTASANQFATTYTWVRFVQGVTLPAANATQFRAVTALTLGTDWFIDEAVLVPTTSTTSYSFPQDLFSQFNFDRTSKVRIS